MMAQPPDEPQALHLQDGAGTPPDSLRDSWPEPPSSTARRSRHRAVRLDRYAVAKDNRTDASSNTDRRQGPVIAGSLLPLPASPSEGSATPRRHPPPLPPPAVANGGSAAENLNEIGVRLWTACRARWEGIHLSWRSSGPLGREFVGSGRL
jgi:hypothetical protein